jgi:hypothetical protein
MTDRIKKFGDFMTSSKMRRFMNHLAIGGNYKGWVLGKSKPFELHIYYTPVKQIIIDMKFYSEIDLDQLNIPFKLGDDIQLVKDWVEKNKYEITFDLNRF